MTHPLMSDHALCMCERMKVWELLLQITRLPYLGDRICGLQLKTEANLNMLVGQA